MVSPPLIYGEGKLWGRREIKKVNKGDSCCVFRSKIIYDVDTEEGGRMYISPVGYFCLPVGRDL